MDRRTALAHIGTATLATTTTALAGCLGSSASGGSGESDSTQSNHQTTSGGSSGAATTTGSGLTKAGHNAYVAAGAYDRSELQLSDLFLLNARDVAVQLEGTLTNVSGMAFDRVLFDVVFHYGEPATETLWQTRTGFTDFPPNSSIDLQIQYRGERAPTEEMTAVIADIDTVEDQ